MVELSTKYILKEIPFNKNIGFCKFTKDSNLLYFGNDYGTIYAYDLQKNYESIF